jgi:hypothetical protein
MTISSQLHYQQSSLFRTSGWLGILLLMGSLTACGTATPVAQLQRRSPESVIAANVSNPLNLWSRLHSTVTVKGQVGRSVPLVQGSIYQLKDGTGQIWIVTRKQAPPVDSTVQIRGKLRYQPISPGSQQRGSLFIEQAD